MKVYMCYLIPVKMTKNPILLGVYSNFETAKKAAELETNSPKASWWTQYNIIETQIIGE